MATNRKHNAKANGTHGHTNGHSASAVSAAAPSPASTPLNKTLSYVLYPFSLIYIILAAILRAVGSLLSLPGHVAQSVYYDLFLGQVLLYNVSFEDARIDRLLLNVKGKVVLTLTSAGDNVLDALTEDASRVIAVDQNLAQTALFELKVAGIKQLTYEQFWAIFGDCNGELFRSVYFSQLRPLLSPASANFWDRRQHYIDDLYYRGGSGWAGWFMMKMFVPVMGLTSMLSSMMAAKTLDEQRAVYAEWKPTFHKVMSVLYHVGAWKWISWLVAVPTNQQSLLSTNWQHYIEHCLDHICERTHLAGENHYYSIYILGKYHKNNCPRYLQADWFAFLKQRIDRIDIRCANLFNVMQDLRKAGIKVDRFNLLDHMDWMDEQTVLTEWQNISECAAPGAMAIWKSISEISSPNVLSFLHNIPAADGIITDFMMNSDCTPTYRCIRCVEIPQDYAFAPRIVPETGVKSFANDMRVVVAMYVLPTLRKLGLAKAESEKVAIKGDMTESRTAMNTFYAPQAALYDSYRHRMLHGRPLLAACMPVKKGGVWIDVGGGTGFNLEYVGNVINNFKRVYVVDVCDPLLEQANKRVAARGWKNVKTIRRDVCSVEGILTPEEESGGVDLITFSYSLTMIPQWRNALDNAYKLLKPGGLIGIADFTVLPSEFQPEWSRQFFTRVFSIDGVHLNLDHRKTLSNKFHTVVNEVRYGGFPYVPGFLSCPYYVFIGERPVEGVDVQANLSPTALSAKQTGLKKRVSSHLALGAFSS